jgi:hypothetical protein
VPIALLATACAMATACGGTPSLVIQSPASGGRVGGNVVTISVAVSNFDITATPSASGAGPAGPIAVYLDNAPLPAAGSPVVPGSKVVSSASTRIPVAGLSVGRHTFTAVLVDSSGNRAGSDAPSTSVTVEGPSVTAQVVGRVTAGTAFSLALSSFGVTINDLPSDTSGRTAHYNVLIDRGMPQPGTVPRAGAGLISTTASLAPMPALAKGTHVIWVVLVNGAGRTLSPLSAAEVTVTVP